MFCTVVCKRDKKIKIRKIDFSCEANSPTDIVSDLSFKMSWDSRDFQKFQTAQDKINQKYDEVFISVFNFKDEYYYVEHNELLENDDVANIVGFVAGVLSKTEN